MVRLQSSTALVVVAAALLAGCDGAPSGADTQVTMSSTWAEPTTTTGERARAEDRPVLTVPDPTAVGKEASGEPAAVPSDGRPRRALLTLPSIDVRHLPVVPYRGRTDDAPGTEIQNGGVAASPHGPRGGVGTGGVGNYQVTAHRTSSTRAFEFLPELRRGDRVIVEVRGIRYVYEVRRTRETSFRSHRSLAEQRAAVPGRPRATPTRAFITLSTCATPEDHAAGNYWADEFDNPEHRIDKIGVLVRTTDS